MYEYEKMKAKIDCLKEDAIALTRLKMDSEEIDDKFAIELLDRKLDSIFSRLSELYIELQPLQKARRKALGYFD